MLRLDVISAAKLSTGPLSLAAVASHHCSVWVESTISFMARVLFGDASWIELRKPSTRGGILRLMTFILLSLVSTGKLALTNKVAILLDC